LESGLTKGYVLITHHGSRNLGAQIYKRGIEAAIKETNKVATDIPKNLAWLDIHTPLGTQYWQALEYAQRWTIANHTLIHSKTLQRIEQTPIATISNAHNFVWEHKGKIMHGKGATPAWLDPLGRKSLGIIPLNMSSEILITLGSNNTDFLSFSPHGAGRNKSRSALMENYKDKKTKELDRNLIEKDFKNATLGLDIRWASKKIDISECPIGYKNKEMIKLQLKNFNLATLVSEVQPMGCIMAGEFEMPWNIKKKKKPIPLEMPTP
jgi:RNA-splicing ligase RtcB